MSADKNDQGKPTRMLTGAQNFSLWLAELKLQLLIAGLSDNAFNPQKLEPPTDAKADVVKMARDSRVINDARTQVKILQTLTDEIASKVIDMAPSEMIKYLTRAYGAETAAGQANETIRIMSVKQKPNQPLMEYLLESTEMAKKISNKSLPLEKVALVATVNGILPEYAAVREWFMMTKPEDMTIEDIVDSGHLVLKFQESANGSSTTAIGAASSK
ncbi:hypothetical protein EC988_001771, partial [Linderina pennispora]